MSDSGDFTARLKAALAANDTSALKALSASLSHEDLPVTQPGVLRHVRANIPGTEEPSVSTLFAPADDRPTNYPTDLPFLSHTLTSVIEFESPSRRPMLQFYHVADPAGAIESLLSQSKSSGWIHDPPQTLGAESRTESLHRGTDRRMLITTTSGTEGMIWLMDLAAGEVPSRAV